MLIHISIFVSHINILNISLMKYLLSLALMLSGLLSASAFTVTQGDGIGDGGIASLVIDFSKTIIDGRLPLADYLADLDETESFENSLDGYYADFMKRFNGRCKQVLLTRSEAKPLTLTVRVLSVNLKGNEANCEYLFSDTASGEVLLAIVGHTHEGRFGSFPNLVGDVMREAGGDFGAYVSKLIKTKGKSGK